MQIRDATEADLAGILAIFNHAIATTTAIWIEHPVEIDNRRQWMQARQSVGYPVLVAVDGSDVLGYAAFYDWGQNIGYRFSVEDSVYIREDQQGRGIGKALMVELISRAQALGKHVMVAAIGSTNQPSIALHEKLGFTFAGHFREVGIKNGEWLDLTYMQKML